MENLRNRVDAELKTKLYVTLVEIRKSKITLALNKPVYAGMCIWHVHIRVKY